MKVNNISGGISYGSNQKNSGISETKFSIPQGKPAATHPATVKTTLKYDNYADTDYFKERLERMQEMGVIPYDAEVPVEQLTEEQIEYLRNNFDPYKVLFHSDREKETSDLYYKLVEMGVLSAQESLLARQGSATSMGNWTQDDDGSWGGNMRVQEVRPASFEAFLHGLHGSQIQWLEGAKRIDADVPIANDVTQARIKVYDLLTKIFGVPTANQTFDAFLATMKAKQK